MPRRRLEDYEQRRKQIELSDVAGDGGTLDTETGIVSYSTRPETVSYAYRTNAPTNATANAAMLPVSWEAVYDEPVLSGDLDGDGELTSADVVLLARYLAGAETLTEAQLTAADLNADGVITSADLVLLARKVAGLEKTRNAAHRKIAIEIIFGVLPSDGGNCPCGSSRRSGSGWHGRYQVSFVAADVPMRAAAAHLHIALQLINSIFLDEIHISVIINPILCKGDEGNGL